MKNNKQLIRITIFFGNIIFSFLFQRREYKCKFLEVETEASRIKDRLETMNQIIDDMQEKMYDFEQNKKNNLIFHGVLADHPETSDG